MRGRKIDIPQALTYFSLLTIPSCCAKLWSFYGIYCTTNSVKSVGRVRSNLDGQYHCCAI